MGELILPIAVRDAVTLVADWVIVLPVVLALLGAALTLMLGRTRAILAVLVTLAVLACDVALLLRVYVDGPLSMTMGNWLPPFGISLTADLFGALFASAAALVTLMVLLYAETERTASNDGDGYHALVLLLLAGVSGAFLTGDLFNLYVWFEVTLIASFGLLVGVGKPLQLDGAVKYGILNFLATTLFLLALGLLYGLLGTLNMADIFRVAPTANPAALTGIAGLLLLAFGAKAAAFPLNAWLPASYHTPPAVVSALFAALLTKVGAYALLRTLVTVLPGSRDVLEPVLLAVAVTTLLIAPLGAIAETNLRRAIGFLVIGGIGAIFAGLALAGQGGIAGAGFYIVHAMLSLTALYLVAGLIERRTGATDTRQMGGLYAASAPLSILFFALILGMASVPPTLGFWPKLLLLEAALVQGDWQGWLLVGALLINAVLTLIAGTRLWSAIFWREAAVPAVLAPDTGDRLRQGITMLVVSLVLAAGLWPNPLFEIVQRGAAQMLDQAGYAAAVGLAGDTP